MAEEMGRRRREDDALRELLLRANLPEALDLPEGLEPVPDALEERMAPFLARPFAAGRRKKPLWARVLRTAAGLLLVLSLTAGAVLWASPAARVWAAELARMLMVWTDVSADFIFHGGDGAETDLSCWRPTWLPEGYEEVEVWDPGGVYKITYENAEGQSLTLRCISPNTSAVSMDNEHSDYSEITINGSKAYLLVSNAEGWQSSLIWTNEENSVMFILRGYISAEDLIRMAESVRITLPRWRPTWLPEGYEEVEVWDVGVVCVTTYRNEEGEEIYFEYSAPSGALTIDNEHSDYSEIEINGCKAHLFASNTEGKPSFLLWMNKEETAFFMLEGAAPPEDLIRMAESISVEQ